MKSKILVIMAAFAAMIGLAIPTSAAEATASGLFISGSWCNTETPVAGDRWVGVANTTTRTDVAVYQLAGKKSTSQAATGGRLLAWALPDTMAVQVKPAAGTGWTTIVLRGPSGEVLALKQYASTECHATPIKGFDLNFKVALSSDRQTCVVKPVFASSLGSGIEVPMWWSLDSKAISSETTKALGYAFLGPAGTTGWQTKARSGYTFAFFGEYAWGIKVDASSGCETGPTYVMVAPKWWTLG